MDSGTEFAVFLKDSGLLWALNKKILHQFGRELKLDFDLESVEFTSWEVKKDKSGSMDFNEEANMDGRAKLEKFINEQ